MKFQGKCALTWFLNSKSLMCLRTTHEIGTEIENKKN